jgi:hypothetical protein
VALTLEHIRAAARAGRISWRRHALIRASQRGITRAQALRVLHTGEIVEQQRRARPFPKVLLMGMILPELPLYVAVGYDRAQADLHVVTMHWLDPLKWEDPWTRRPKPPKLRNLGRRRNR